MGVCDQMLAKETPQCEASHAVPPWNALCLRMNVSGFFIMGYHEWLFIFS